MLKLVTTLVRGAVAEAEEAVHDANATRLLAQQLREAASALVHSKKELACAMAYRASECRAVDGLDTRIAELEASAVAAIKGGREDLARDAAAVIAAIEDERRGRREAITRFDSDIARLRQLTETGLKRLVELRRGLELARVDEALQRAGASGRRAMSNGTSALRDAEATLQRIKDRQSKDNDVGAALDELDRGLAGDSLDRRMAEAGFGSMARTPPEEVLARLKARIDIGGESPSASPER